jgi:hypothetical protein
MGSSKQQSAISKVTNLLQEWDKGSKVVRAKILVDFIFEMTDLFTCCYIAMF